MANEQEHRISYKAGITCSPSDFLCQNGELAECINLTTDHEELKPIVPPVEYMEVLGGMTVKFVHKFNDQERLIGYETVDDKQLLCWGVVVEGSYATHSNFEIAPNQYLECTDDVQITAIGKILIISANNDIHYFLWKYTGNHASRYEYMGNAFPAPEIEFKLGERNEKDYTELQAAYSILYNSGSQHDIYAISAGKNKEWNDVVVGLYERLRNRIWREKKFHGSFCVRAALQLSDGSYTHISNPIFMLNHFSEYGVASINGDEEHLVSMHMKGQHLYYKFSQDYSKWSDIIKNVVLFVTREANTVDILSDAICVKGTYPEPGNGYDNLPNDYISYFMAGEQIYHDEYRLGSSMDSGSIYRVLRPVADSELSEMIKDGTYYKLCEIGTSGTGDWIDVGQHIDAHTIETLTTRTRLEEDDYYSHCPLKGSFLYAYNSRLNVANVSRGFFRGFNNFMPFRNEDESTYRTLVTIETDNGQVVVENTFTTRQKQGLYYYYPDPRAKHVDIFKGDTQILNENLIEHPRLNGAYYFAGVSPTMDEPLSATSHEPAVSDTPFEQLSNYLLTSEVDNPFVFKAKGYNKVGTGKILAMSTTTMALSQDQFGKTDLIVFSESGIWGMQVDRTGLYDNIHSITRDVLINPHNVIQTDGAVFFVTQKGLMVISEKGVSCVSEQMNGPSFNYGQALDILPDTDWSDSIIPSGNAPYFQEYICSPKCVIAYDYIDSRLFIANPDYDYNYILNIADGAISKSVSVSGVTNVINNYPDYLLQSGTMLYSLYEKPRDEDYQQRTLAFLITRPLKLTSPVSKASIMELLNVGYWDGGSVVKTEIYMSDDLRHWYKKDSRYGAAAKYYRLALYIRMLPTERLSGTIISTLDKRNNHMR